MSFFGTLPTVQVLQPKFNVGCLFDIPTGRYHKGVNGENVLAGGITGSTSIEGPANSFKTVVILYINLTMAERIREYALSIYDTENSLTYDRINQLCSRLPRMSKIAHGDVSIPPEEQRITLTSSAEMFGDEYFDHIREACKLRAKDKNSKSCTTAFIDGYGKPVKVHPPIGVIVDSLTAFTVNAVEDKIVGKNKLGESGNNMMYMRQGMAKKQLITQLPNLTNKNTLMVSLTAHITDEFEMDAYAPEKRRLTHSKRGSKASSVGQAHDYLVNVIYEIFSSKPLNNKERKTGVLYPLVDSDRTEHSKDLMLVTMVCTRNKGGQTGHMLPIVVSQREGVLEHLTQFHFIKESNRFGLVGNNTTYQLSLLPDVNLSRTTVRGKIDTTPALRRALEITSELLQITTLWSGMESIVCDPSILYEDLISKGYDWEVLLNTRGYHILFESEADEPLPYLSTMDLLEMRLGTYAPSWYKMES